jgi:hypothetical protein
MRAEYVWDELYTAAILEADDGKLPTRIHAAKSAIDRRLQEMQKDHGGTPEEWQAKKKPGKARHSPLPVRLTEEG